MKTESIGLRVSEELLEKLKEAAKKEDRSLSNYINRKLENLFNGEE